MNKRFVRSWDVFDTLIARRCGTYDTIFEIMGRALGEDFRTSRIRAEAIARESKYEISIDDIYDVIQKEKDWTQQERQYALELEISTEFANVIPITENMSLVQNGDILVSDMYLSPDVILGLLRKAGLDKVITLYVSTRGKHDGSIWKQIKTQCIILKHTGDNPSLDFMRPLQHLIPAALTNSSAETPWERFLSANGAPELSCFIREMRLRSHRTPPKFRALQAAQIEVNFPLLLLASASLILWCCDQGISRALMSSRDCNLWSSLAEKVASHIGDSVAVEYFLISRVAALKSSKEYLAYAGRKISADSVVVDLSMTGISLAGLADRLGIAQVNAFVIALHKSAAKSLYGDKFQPKAKINFRYLFAELAHQDLEAFNQALVPSVHDVTETAEGLSVEYALENRSPSALEAVKVQNATFLDMVDRVPETVLDEAFALARSTRLTFLVRECERHAGDFKTILTRASPGSALRNDPNGIKLNLPYASTNPIARRFAAGLKLLLKPLFRVGSPLHPYRGIPHLIARRHKRHKDKVD
ncbi:hypothetical protein [Pusillimonas minor]|uniref:Uncharacterized protein n=1 Tax=Pusillimonas minor TaxID=2697024 RepID=A0A842HR49_9BURK|nr:hypothetical protein [Pusillimonas minor]MBC2769840.1 hypothetical protein [Pusillimonas minor]